MIVPCFNAAEYLDKCIEYLLRQTMGLENMEIILVNDASTDDGATWNVITGYERKFPDTIMAVLLDQNMRQGGARNVGISYARGEYLIFCDADDWLLEETLARCYSVAKEYDADVVEFLIRNVQEHDLTVELSRGDNSRLIELDTDEKRREFLLCEMQQCSFGSQKKMYKRSLIEDNHIRFAEHLIFEEPSFMLPVRLYEKRHYFLDELLYICYLSPESTVRGEWGIHKWDNPKVWVHLMHDLEARGLLHDYHAELEYLFFAHGLGLSIRMALQKGYWLTKEELAFLTGLTLEMFPDIRKNRYIEQHKRIWYELMLTLLTMEITEESTQTVNEILIKYL